MAQQLINVGILENDQTGDTLRAAFQKINGNFSELYTEVAAVSLSSFSVGPDAAASGSGGLAYNNLTGVYTYTPPDLGSFLTSETSHADVLVDGDFPTNGLMATNGAGTYSIVTDSSINWNTAYGWGDHSIAGYLTDLTGSGFTTLSDVDAAGAGQDGYVLYYDHGTTSFKWKVDSGGLAYTDFSVNQNGASGAGTLTYNNGTGQFDYTPPDLSGFLTAETDPVFSAHTTSNIIDGTGFLKNNGAGTWSYDSNTYLTAETSHADVLVDGDFGSAGIMATDGAGTYNIVTDNSANWNTAYGWGDHSVAGYTSYTDSDVDTHLNQSNPTAGYVLSWNGSDYAWVAQSSGGTPAGANTEIQFNNSGAFGASANLTWNGTTLNITGALTATTKSFLIDHPTKSDMKLQYGSLEGPENGVYVRGKLENTNIIELPDYWTGLVDEDTITVQLTPNGKFQKLFVSEIKNNKIVISNDSWFSNNTNCFYIVFAERKDVDRLKVEF